MTKQGMTGTPTQGEVKPASRPLPQPGRPGAGDGVRAEALCKVYRSGESELPVLTGVNLSVAAGEMVAIVGPSGSGKSTLLHLLAALDTPTSGKVYFAGSPLDSMSEAERAEFRRRSIGFVWQRHHLLGDFTAAENVATPLFLRGVSRAEGLRDAQGLLEEVGLRDRGGHRASELSGGEQQRVAIARALVNRPQVLLADEPTGDLDEQNADAVFGLMQRLHKSYRLTSILATHNLGLARRCDRVLALQHGSLSPGEEFLPGQSRLGASAAGAAGNTERELG